MEVRLNAPAEDILFQAVVKAAKGVKAHEVSATFTGQSTWPFSKFLRQLLSSLGLHANYRPFYYSVSHRCTAHTGWLPLQSLDQLFSLVTPRIRLVRKQSRPRKRLQTETPTLIVPYTGAVQAEGQVMDLQSLMALNQALMTQQCWLMSCMLRASGCVFNSH